jgi:hypothetical protein
MLSEDQIDSILEQHRNQFEDRSIEIVKDLLNEAHRIGFEEGYDIAVKNDAPEVDDEFVSVYDSILLNMRSDYDS